MADRYDIIIWGFRGSIIAVIIVTFATIGYALHIQSVHEAKSIEYFKTIDCKAKLQVLVQEVNNGTSSNEPYNTQLQLYDLECLNK